MTNLKQNSSNLQNQTNTNNPTLPPKPSDLLPHSLKKYKLKPGYHKPNKIRSLSIGRLHQLQKLTNTHNTNDFLIKQTQLTNMSEDYTKDPPILYNNPKTLLSNTHRSPLRTQNVNFNANSSSGLVKNHSYQNIHNMEGDGRDEMQISPIRQYGNVREVCEGIEGRDRMERCRSAASFRVANPVSLNASAQICGIKGLTDQKGVPNIRRIKRSVKTHQTSRSMFSGQILES